MLDSKSFPKDAIDLWPEIFSEVEINVVPLQYVCGVRIFFKNKKIWEVSFNKSTNYSSIENQIKETVSKYEEQIDKVDFKLNTIQIKKDIIKRTNKFLKSKKL